MAKVELRSVNEKIAVLGLGRRQADAKSLVVMTSGGAVGARAAVLRLVLGT
jgi:hypothetical protein